MDIRKWINTAVFLLMIVVNVLANSIPLGGQTTGEVSAMYETLFTPAPITFSIWIIIYVGLLVFILFQLGWFDHGEYSDVIRNDIGYVFAVSCLFNIAWILSWQYRHIGLSLLFIICLLGSLLLIESVIRKRRGIRKIHVYVSRIFELYLGWIIAASIANFCAVLKYLGTYGFDGESEVFTVLLVIGCAFIGFVSLKYTASCMTCLGIIWALIGVCIKHIGTAGFGGGYMIVPISAILAVAALIFPVFVRINTDS